MSNSGKTSIYINLQNYIEDIMQENFDSKIKFSQTTDRIRYYSGYFWTNNNGILEPAYKTLNNKMFDILYDEKEENVIILRAKKDKFSDKIINQAGILEQKYSTKLWIDFNKYLLDEAYVFYEDYYINLPELVNLSEVKDVIAPGINFLNKEFVYNFHAKRYEALLQDKTVSITSLPSLFAAINDQQLDKRTYEENLVLTFGGLIPQTFADSLQISKENSETVTRYYDFFADRYGSDESRTVISTLDAYNANLKISKNALSILNKISFIPFPWYSKIKFTNLAAKDDNFLFDIQKFETVKTNLFNSIQDSFSNYQNIAFVNKKDSFDNIDLKAYDLKAWLDNILVEITSSENINYSLVEYTNFLDVIKKKLKPKVRKYKEFTNVSCDNHILMYKIEKRVISQDRKEPVQTFWLTPNTDKIINFIDTQIKYGTEYYYKIYAYVMVVGNKYSYKPYSYKYEEQRLEDIAEGMMKYYVNNESSYKILELEVGKFSGAVHEQPPTAPEVSFEKDENVLRINLKQSKQASLEEFINIENSDFIKFDAIRRSQDNDEKDKIYSKILESDNKDLQIYRINFYPTNYLSFQGKLFKTLSLKNEVSFSDSLVPNIKYYYLFRYLNDHDVPSNVSKVYEVEMRNEDGFLYLLSKEIEVNKTQKKSTFKNLKRYLLVRPSVIQTQLNLPEKIRSYNDISLGPDGDSVWYKDFLLKITSKKTNRVLEFNIKAAINKKN